MKHPRLLALFALLAAPAARADEGMWTYDQFPAAQVKARHGFAPDRAWLDRARLGSAYLGGCSSSFVSPKGLILTNHHCAQRCVHQLSSVERDLMKDGFVATEQAQELRCSGMEINQLQEIKDVTARVAAATRGAIGEAYQRAQRAELARIESECGPGERVRCDVKALHQGGLYHLYRYRRITDVRLVFAPEFAIAFFGGDPQNFMFPRYDLDVAFLRAYEDGRPAATPDFLRFADKPPREGDLVFASGHPGRTSRQLTIAQLRFLRDVDLPAEIARLSELRGELLQFQRRGPAAARAAESALFSTENAIKVRRGQHQALVDDALFSAKATAEDALRRRIAAAPELAANVGDAFEQVARAQDERRRLYREYASLERGYQGYAGSLAGIARTLVRAARERGLPSEKRAREYQDGRLGDLTQALFSAAPIDPDLEILRLTFYLRKLREELGVEHPAVRAALGVQAPLELAEAAIRGTELFDVARRRALWDGGLAASKDPLIDLARRLEPLAWAARQRFEDQVESVEKRAQERIARARFALDGAGIYPDATGTLRLSFGRVRGLTEPDGRVVPAQTTFGGLYEVATGRPPFALPPRWLAARGKLDPAQPLNLITDADGTGGNSGSPVLDREGRIIGVLFDGNIHSLGGEYGYDGSRNRSVLVHGQGLLTALRQIYGATALLRELGK